MLNTMQRAPSVCANTPPLFFWSGADQWGGAGRLCGKPSYRQLVNAGVYVIDPQLLPLLPHHQATDMPTLLQSAQKVGHRVAVCPIHEYWIDVGRPEPCGRPIKSGQRG